MVRVIALAAMIVVGASVALAADLEGVSMPDTRVVDGTRMHLNGIGLRTFSLFGIPIYVAGLYLEQRSGDAATILRSREHKFLDIRFLRDVDAADARQAWQDSFGQNCRPPCHLDVHDMQRFLAAVPAVRKGDVSTLLFTERGVQITFNGRPLGDIPDGRFAGLLLATFIGDVPPTPRLKRELLGLRD